MIEIQDTSTNNLHAIGQIISEYKPYRNAFIDTLINRVAFVIVTSKTWNSPWAFLMRGTMDLGESIEEVFVNIANPFDFNPDVAEKHVFRREFPDVRVTFHYMDYQKYYKVTVSQQQLRTAFLAWSGISDLVTRIVDSLYTGMNYDMYITVKYMLCRAILNGGVGSYKVSDFTDTDNLGDLIAAVKGTVNQMQFLSPNYNAAGVMNAIEGNDVYCFIDTYLDAHVDVNVLASAFNMDKTEFIGRKVLIDGWDRHDTARLAMLFANDPDYTAFTAEELAILGGVGALVCERDLFMMFTNLEEMENINNGEGLYWNYWLHRWCTFSMSPFAQAVAFTKDAFTVTSVVVNRADGSNIPAEGVTLRKGGSMQFEAVVSGTGIFNHAVKWTLEGAEQSGTYMMGNTIRIATDETADVVTIYATSIADPTVRDGVYITVS